MGSLYLLFFVLQRICVMHPEMQTRVLAAGLTCWRGILEDSICYRHFRSGGLGSVGLLFMLHLSVSFVLRFSTFSPGSRVVARLQASRQPGLLQSSQDLSDPTCHFVQILPRHQSSEDRCLLLNPRVVSSTQSRR
jgi:hypothetical protein